MKAARKRYSPDFKAKVALEAIRGDLALAELAAKHGVHHTVIASWEASGHRRDGRHVDGSKNLFFRR